MKVIKTNKKAKNQPIKVYKLPPLARESFRVRLVSNEMLKRVQQDKDVF